MNFYAIISEFNPFHTGHRHLIRETRANTDAEAIVCIMSGSMVQRGDVAVYDKWTRAKAAVENGADLVVELPVSYVLQSADIFARGGVELASGLGASGIAFGSEVTDLPVLNKVARLREQEPEEYTLALKSALDTGMGYPAACEYATRATLGEVPEALFNPNATLGIAYISAIQKLAPSMKIFVTKRDGDHHSAEEKGPFASGMAIRQKILSGDNSSPYSLCTSNRIYDINNMSDYILGFFRTCDEKGLQSIAGMEEGLSRRLKKMSMEATNFKEFVSMCSTKRYTEHRIRRIILCSVLGIKDAPSPEYARVLALNSKGARIIKSSRGAIEFVTKITNSSQSPMLQKDILATDLASLCAGVKAGMDYTTSPYVAK